MLHTVVIRLNKSKTQNKKAKILIVFFICVRLYTDNKQNTHICVHHINEGKNLASI